MRRTQSRAATSGSRLSIFKGLLFALIAVGAWVFVNVDNLQEFIDTYQKREAEREQIEALNQRIRKLKRQQQSLAFNGVESDKQIRERMGLHLPGEQVLFLKEEETAAAPADKAAGAEKEEVSQPPGAAQKPESTVVPQEKKPKVNKTKSVK